MDQYSFAVNETLQLHELLTLKNTCLTKSLLMSPLVSDQELKTLLDQDAAQTKQHIEELRGFFKASDATKS